MGPVNGRPPMNVPQFTAAELKEEPCPCGSNEWTQEVYVVRMVHRIQLGAKVRVVKSRDVCRACGHFIENQ